MVLNPPDDTVITRHPLANPIARSGGVLTTEAIARQASFPRQAGATSAKGRMLVPTRNQGSRCYTTSDASVSHPPQQLQQFCALLLTGEGRESSCGLGGLGEPQDFRQLVIEVGQFCDGISSPAGGMTAVAPRIAGATAGTWT